MSDKKDPEIKSIIEGFQMLGSETGGLINPKELKEIMEIMSMKEKNPFLYSIIEKFCNDPKVEQKGGIEAEDFISELENQLNDTSSMEGLFNLFTVFFNPITKKIPITTFSQIAKSIGDDEEEEKVKYLTNKAQLGDKELNFNEFNKIIPLESPKRKNEKMIYKKKSSKMEGRDSFHKYSKSNNIYNKVNHKANNCVIKNFDEMSPENFNDSMKNDEITFNVNKYNNQIEKEIEYDKINSDVNNFGNAKNKYQNNYEKTDATKEEMTKKKYRHVRKTKSTNYEEEVERNRNDIDINKNENEMKENDVEQKEEDEIPKTGRYRYARSKGEIKANKDKGIEIDDLEDIEDITEKKGFENEEKSDVKACKRYHRRYRETRGNTPDRNEKINNGAEN